MSVQEVICHQCDQNKDGAMHYSDKTIRYHGEYKFISLACFKKWRASMFPKKDCLPLLVWTAVLVIFFIGLFFSFNAFGQSRPTFTVGQPTEYSVPMVFCDTEAQAYSIMETHAKSGYDAARALLSKLHQTRNKVGESSCGNTDLRIVVLEVYKTMVLTFKNTEYKVNLVRFYFVRDKTKEIFYSPLFLEQAGEDA